MANKLVIAPEALDDIDEAYAWFESFRRRLLRRFPYAVFYEFEQLIVTVYCVSHASRNPNIWKNRLS